MTENNPMHSENTKKKLSKTIKKKIKNGTWHNSFSKSRTHKYNSKFAGEVKLHGKWELNYAKYLDDNDIHWRRPKESFYYEFNNKNGRYTPDFYLINRKIYIEIKGYETDKDRAKWKWFPLELKVIKGKELKKMNIIKEYREI
jgi:hypothetical protein